MAGGVRGANQPTEAVAASNRLQQAADALWRCRVDCQTVQSLCLCGNVRHDCFSLFCGSGRFNDIADEEGREAAVVAASCCPIIPKMAFASHFTVLATWTGRPCTERYRWRRARRASVRSRCCTRRRWLAVKKCSCVHAAHVPQRRSATSSTCAPEPRGDGA